MVDHQRPARSDDAAKSREIVEDVPVVEMDEHVVREGSIDTAVRELHEAAVPKVNEFDVVVASDSATRMSQHRLRRVGGKEQTAMATRHLGEPAATATDLEHDGAGPEVGRHGPLVHVSRGVVGFDVGTDDMGFVPLVSEGSGVGQAMPVRIVVPPARDRWSGTEGQRPPQLHKPRPSTKAIALGASHVHRRA